MNISKLVEISKKPKRKILGLMSGTSLDGLDIALCEFSGSGQQTQVFLLNFTTKPYDTVTRERIKSVFCKENIKLQDLCLLNPWLGTFHGELVLEALKDWNVNAAEIDLVASHGQTVYHAPASLHRSKEYKSVNSTLQLGDGDHVAAKTGIITVSDSRQRHVAAGGEGAPLAPYGDWLLFSSFEETRLMLNIGGIANFTLLPRHRTCGHEILFGDTGPGNTLIDAAVQHYGLNAKGFDENGDIAKQGQVHCELLKWMLTNPFFKLPLPKTTGQELFNWNFVTRALESVKDENGLGVKGEDVVATLTKLTAVTIADSIKNAVKDAGLGHSIVHVYVSGGGGKNPMLMQYLQDELNEQKYQLHGFGELGIPGDAKEAVIFACLANETVCGQLSSGGRNSGPWPRVTMGKICFPN